MTPEQSDLIYRHFKDLVHNCDLLNFLKDVAQKSPPIFEIISNLSSENNILHRNRCILFALLKLKNCNVFPELIKFLRANELSLLADGLEYGDVYLPHYAKPEQRHSNVRRNPADVRFSDRFYDTDEFNKTRYYRTRSRNRGSVLIINNTKFDNNEHLERDGAVEDERNLKDLFEAFKFEVVLHRNLKTMDMCNKAQEFAQNDSENKPDICVVIIMSHGGLLGNKTVIIGSDNKGVYEDWFKELFNNEHCAKFKDKPKILIFHVCRTELHEQVQRSVQSTTETDSMSKDADRIYSDMIVCHPSVEGFLAHRDIHRGCWYIQLICKVFKEHAHEMDVESMLKKVDEELEMLSHTDKEVEKEMRKRKQTSTFQNIAFKNCYIHPGVYEENGRMTRFH